MNTKLKDLGSVALLSICMLFSGFSSASLNLTVEANPNPAKPGEAIQTRLTVTNTGNSTSDALRLELRYPEHVSRLAGAQISGGGACDGSFCESLELVIWNLGNLSAGAGVTVSLPPTVLSGSSAPADGTTINFAAELFENNVSKASGNQSVIVQSRPVMNLSVNEDHNPVATGDILTYSLTYGNRDPASAFNTELRFPLPAGTSFVSATGDSTEVGNEVVWNLGTLQGHQGGRQQVVVRVGNLQPGTLLEVDAATLTGEVDLITRQAKAISVVWVQENAPLAVALMLNPDPVQPGAAIQTVLTVTNRGDSPLFNVFLKLRYPEHVNRTPRDQISNGGACDGSFCEILELARWNLGNLPAGAGVSVSLPPIVLSGSSAPAGGTLINVVADASEDSGYTASSEHTVIVQSNPVLNLAVNENLNPVAPGDILTYTLTYGNRDSVSALNTELRFPLPPGTSFVSATGGGKLNDSENEIIWNLPTLQGHQGGQQKVEVGVKNLQEGTLLKVDAATLTGEVNLMEQQARSISAVWVQENNPLALTLIANPDPVQPGKAMQTELAVTNRGDSMLFNVVLKLRYPEHINRTPIDKISGGGACNGSFCETLELATWNLGNLPAGAGMMVSLPPIVLSGSSAPVGGTLINLAAEASEDSGLTASSEHTVIVQSNPVLNLAVNENLNPVAPADILTYTLTYGNRDSVSALNTELRFPLPPGTSFVSATGGGKLNDSENEITWNLPTLQGHQGGQQKVVVDVKNLQEGTLLKVDAATLTGEVNLMEQQARSISAVWVQENNPLALTLMVNPDPVQPGEAMQTELAVTNSGDSMLFNVVLKLRYPEHVNRTPIVQVSDGGACNGSFCETLELVTWNLGNLPTGERVTVSLPPVVLSGSSAPADGTLIDLWGHVVSDSQGQSTQSATVLVNPFTDNDQDGNPDVFDPDDDNGGAPDYWEIKYGFNPFSSVDDGQDTDNDRLTNIQEWMQGTDPHDPDTDNDEIPDGDDPRPLTAECSGNIVVIDFPFKNGVVFNCNAQTSIVTQGNVVGETGSVVFFGAPVIHLGPGFSVQLGANFRSVAN